MNLTVLAALLFLQYPDAPQQQPQPQSVCQAGQIVVDAEGHCCWPGQAWKKRGCHGKPYCPQGLVADRRDNCVPAQAPAPQPQPQYQPPPQPQYQPQPGTYNPYPDAPQAPGTFAGVPTMPAPNAVPVRFTAAKPEDSYEVEVLTNGMPVCKTPCELRLVPDRHAYKVRVKGAAHFSDKLRVLNQPMDLQIQRGSGGFKALGTVSVIVGGVAFAGGLVASGLVALAAQSDRNEHRYPTDPNWARKRNEKLAITGSVGFAGLVVAVVGGVVGFKKAGQTGVTEVRASQAPAPAPEAAPAPEGAPAPAPEAAPPPPPPSSRRDEPALQLLAIGAAPTENGVQLGALFAF